MIKIRNLHNLIDRVEKVSLKKNETINVSILTSPYGGLLVDIAVFDRSEVDGDVEFEIRKTRSFAVERNGTPAYNSNNAAAYKDCRNYLKKLIKKEK